MNLTDEEKEALKTLCEIENKGESVGYYINNLLYTELSHCDPDITNKNMRKLLGFEEEGFQRQLSIYEGLAEKGAVKASGKPGFMTFEELTSDGRRYFNMEKEAAEAARKAKWSDRRFTIFMALLSFALSVLASYIIAADLIGKTLA